MLAKAPPEERRAIDKEDLYNVLAYLLDGWHFDRLEDARPDVADVVRKLVQAGAEADEIRRWATDRAEHECIALWLAQAARFCAIEEIGS